MKKTAVVLGANNLYAIGCCVNIMALERKSPNLADKYIVYYENWDENLIEKLKAFSDKVEMIEFTRKMYDDKYLSEKMKNDEKLIKFLNRYSHFGNIFPECCLLLDRFNQIIFIDSDFIIIDDVSELKNIDTVAWRGGVATFLYKEISLNRPNGGLFIIPDTVPYHEMSQKYHQYFLETNFNELAMCAMMYDLNIETKNLPADYNYGCHLWEQMKVENHIKIYHAVGREKIWNSEFLRCLFPEYIEYLNYFNINYTREEDEPLYSRDDFIISMLRWKGILGMPGIEILNPYIYLNAVNGEMRYYYKNFVNVFFRVRRTGLDEFRIYFQVNKEKTIRFKAYISTFPKVQALLPADYKFYKYSENALVYYKDCKRDDLNIHFNKMISVFTCFIDDYFDHRLSES